MKRQRSGALASTLIAILLFVSIVTLAACDETAQPSKEGLPQDLTGQQTQLEAQLSAVKRAQTATAQAQAARATAEAKATRQAIDAASVAATAEAKATTQTQAAYAFALTATADALAVANRNAEATATAQARTIQATAQAITARATAEAIERQRLQAEIDAEATRRNAVFYSYLWPVVGVLVTLTAFIFGMVALNQWLVVIGLRRTVLETRAGTLHFLREGNNYTAQLLQPPMLPPVYDAPTEAHVIDAEANMLKVNTAQGVMFIAKQDPQEAVQVANCRLVLRLLRAAIQMSGGQANKVAGWRDLGWPPETWSKAVSLLKPHVMTKAGKGGGTFLVGEWRTLAQLYAAVGERRVALSPTIESDAV